jgi:hypothetical protein
MSSGTHNANDNRVEAETLMRLVTGYHVSQALYVAAYLNLANHLAEGATTAHELTHHTGNHAPSLLRFLRTLASVGIVDDAGSGGFALTPLGKCLTTQASPSIRDNVLAQGSANLWQGNVAAASATLRRLVHALASLHLVPEASTVTLQRRIAMLAQSSVAQSAPPRELHLPLMDRREPLAHLYYSFWQAAACTTHFTFMRGMIGIGRSHVLTKFAA